jgi:hypothetical protein
VTQPERVRRLRDTITDEALKSMGLPASGWPRKLIAPAIGRATNRFAGLFAALDQDIARLGFCQAARRFLPHFVIGCQQSGAGSIPDAGPLLVAANHPGATDGLVIAAALPRDDLRIVISDVPFTRALSSGREHLIYASWDANERAHAVREMIRHLRDGGAVLIFPSGHLDPDPACMPGAAAWLADWSRSVVLALRRVPETWLVATIVGGVLVPRFLSHPLVRLGPQGWKRQKLAEVLQIICQLLFKTRYALTPRVTFGQPTTLAALREQSTLGDLEAIVNHARQVLAAHLAQDRAAVVPFL